MRYIATIFLLSILPLSSTLAQTISSEEMKSVKESIVITREEIEQAGNKDLAKLLHSQNGITVTNAYANTSSTKKIIFQGSTNNEVLILVDGSPVFNARESNITPATADFDILTIPLDAIQQIKITKGGQSVDSGHFGITGVIEITTRGIEKEQLSINGKTSYGSFQTQTNNIHISSSPIKYVALSGNLTTENAIGIDERSSINIQNRILLPPPDVSRDSDGFKRDSYIGKIRVTPLDGLEALGSIYYSEYKRDFDDLRSLSQTEASFLKQSVVLSYKFSAFQFSSSYTFSKSNTEIIDTSLRVDDNSTFKSLTAQVRYAPFTFMSLKAGYDRQELADAHPRFLFNTWTVFLGNKTKSTISTPYLSSLLSFDKLSVELGFRYIYREHLETPPRLAELVPNPDVFKDYYTYSVAASYLFNEYIQFRSSYSRTTSQQDGNSVVSFFDIDLDDIFTGNSENQFFDTSLKYLLPNKTTVLSSRFFYHRSFVGKEFIGYRLGLIGVIGDQEVHGIELDMEHKFTQRLSAKAFYSYLKPAFNNLTPADLTFATSTELTQQRTTAVLQTPNHQYSAAIIGRPLDKLFVNLEAQYIGSRNGGYHFQVLRNPDQLTNFDPFTLVNVYAEYTVIETKLVLFGDVKNILNSQTNVQLGFNSIGTTAALGARFAFK